MEDQKQIKAIFKRDQWFNLVTLIAIAIPFILQIMSYIEEWQNYTITHQRFIKPFPFAEPNWIVFFLILLVLSRWLYFESPNYNLYKASLPVSKKNWLKYDLFIGYLTILILTVSFTLIDTWKENCLFPSVQNFNGARIYVNKEFLLHGTLMLMIYYTLFLIGKHISTNLGWSILFGVVTSCIVFALISEIYSLLWACFGNRFKSTTLFYSNDPVHLMIGIIFLILLNIIAYGLVKKKDEAKHGAYYFTWAQLLVCVSTPLLTFFFLLEKIKTGTRPTSVYIRNTFLIIICIGIFIGLYLMTKPKKQ